MINRQRLLLLISLCFNGLLFFKLNLKGHIHKMLQYSYANESASNSSDVTITDSVIRSLQNLSKSHPHIYMNEFELNNFLVVGQAESEVLFNGNVVGFANISDLVFIIMSSFATRRRVEYQLQTWLRGVEHFYVFADQSVPTMKNFITLPEIQGKSTYQDAQHRQLRGMKWLRKEKPEICGKSWFILVDDDTWINIPALTHFLLKYSPQLPAAFGWVEDRYENDVYFAGGAGMVLTRTAFLLASDHLYSDGFQFAVFNDRTLAASFRKVGIIQVHSDKFNPEPVDTITHNFDKLKPPNYVSAFSFHHMKSVRLMERMTCDSFLFWNYSHNISCSSKGRYENHIQLKD